MGEVNNRVNRWDAERILYAYLYDSDEEGYLPEMDTYNKSSYTIGVLRFYAALRAYGKSPDWFFKDKHAYQWIDRKNVFRRLLGNARSQEKMDEFRELVKKNLRRTPRYEYIVQAVDAPNYLESDLEVGIVFGFLMEYRKKLFAVEDIWSGMMECSKSVGTIFDVTRDMTREHLWPMCQTLDRMLILLMGDDYDKSFTAEDLRQFGYPDVTDDELHQMSMEEEW